MNPPTVAPLMLGPADLVDPEKVANGPMVVYWNQTAEIERGRPLEWGPRPRRNAWHWLLRFRLWKVGIRLAPPPGAELRSWGHALAVDLGLPFGELEEGDQAVYLVASAWARNAPAAIGQAGSVLERLHGSTFGAFQIRVERWR